MTPSLPHVLPHHGTARMRASAVLALVFTAACSVWSPTTAGSAAAAPSSPPAVDRTDIDIPATTLRTLRTVRTQPREHPSLALGSRRPGPGESTAYDVTYTSGGLRITGVLLLPPSRGSHPGVVLVHGFVDPETFTSGSELVREQRWLSRTGHVVLVPDLRNLAGSDRDDAGPSDLDMGSTLDVVNAIRALRSSRIAGLDRHDISLVGHSLGGLLALNAAVIEPSALSAVVALAPSNADPWVNVEYFLTPGDGIYDAIVDAHGTPITNPRYWRDVTPTTFVRRSTPPLLILQGTADDVLPPAWAGATSDAWGAQGGRVRLSLVDGADHLFEPRGAQAMLRMIEFLNRR